MSEKNLKSIIHANAQLAEGPSWDEDNQRLYWVDILGKKLHIYDPVKDVDQAIQFEQFIGAAVPRNKDEVVLAMHHGMYIYNMSTSKLTFIADPEADKNTRFNDGKCDPAGRFWAGTMGLGGESNAGALYRLDHNQVVTKMVSDVGISNGLVWSLDHTKFYYIDTNSEEVVAYDYDLETGNINNPKVVVRINPEEGKPDGMTIDSEGMLWVAHWGGWKVSRWNPETGDCMDEIKVPCSLVTSCVFGGAELNELYITTARVGISEDNLLKEPLAGNVFRVKMDVKGSPTYSYKG